MVKNISVLGAFKLILLLLIVTGVGFYSKAFIQPFACVLIVSLLVFMIAEDWVNRTIDVLQLMLLTVLLLYGSFDRYQFCLKYLFLLLFFRACFLWLMRFEPSIQFLTEQNDFRNIQIGFLPFFCASICFAYILIFSHFDFFMDIYYGYLAVSDQIVNSPEILSAILVVLVVIALFGEKRRRSVPANYTEIWPFGDGDVWFLSAWGAAMPFIDFFIVFFISQLMLLITYAIKYFMDGDLQHE